VARGEGADTYRDPREFYRITYITGQPTPRGCPGPAEAPRHSP
jgi:hypothetical protein